MIPIDSRVVRKNDLIDISNPQTIIAGTVVGWTVDGLIKIQWDDGAVGVYTGAGEKLLETL